MSGRSLIIWLALGGVAAGCGLWLAGAQGAADLAWAATVILTLAPLSITVVRDLLHRDTGVDLIALLAMTGSLVLGQFLAGAVVGLMLSGGQALERFAEGRARRELTALLKRAPRTVNVYRKGELVTADITTVAPGDQLLVKPGEVVPVDGVVTGQLAMLDESALTGESRPVERASGDRIASGGLNVGGPFDLRAVATADQSTYAAIIRLVSEAQSAKAPFVRVADRYALWFLPLTLAIAGAAWLLSRDPVRALAVLVVATPCPLILAAPVAIVAGISRAAHRGVIVKGGGALETLARAQTLVFDKTGTLTAGAPQVASVVMFDTRYGEAELLRLAASLDQVSAHVFAAAIVAAARSRGLPLDFPTDVDEQAGSGISGRVGDHQVALGKARWLIPAGSLPKAAEEVRRRVEAEGTSNVFVSCDGRLAAALVIADPLRADAPQVLRGLHAAGIRRIVVLTGDRAEAAQAATRGLGADGVLSERAPAQKLATILEERRRGVTVMVGDGVNDAPALAAADVGIAMGARGATAASESADVVIVVDRLDRVTEALLIGRRARQVAVQSVLAGMALSGLGVLLATGGWLAPVAGAVFQEAIDVAVILNALRALGGGFQLGPPRPIGHSDVEAERPLAAGRAAMVAIRGSRDAGQRR